MWNDFLALNTRHAAMFLLIERVARAYSKASKKVVSLINGDRYQRSVLLPVLGTPVVSALLVSELSLQNYRCVFKRRRHAFGESSL